MPWERVILLQRLLALKKWLAHPHVSYIFGFCSMSGSHRHPQNLPKSLQVVARADLAAPLDCPLWHHQIVHFCPWRVISISATVFLEISLCICSPLYWIPFLVGWFLSYVQSNSFRWKNNVKVADNIAEDMEGEEEITAGVILCRTWVKIGTAANENYEAIRTQHMSLVTSELLKKLKTDIWWKNGQLLCNVNPLWRTDLQKNMERRVALESALSKLRLTYPSLPPLRDFQVIFRLSMFNLGLNKIAAC